MKTILAALALATPLALTSCEGTLDDVFGEWDKPSANTNTDSGSDSTPAVSNNYMEWDGSDLAAQAIPTTGIQEVTDATTSFEGGFYIVKKDVTIASDALINGDTKIILCDGVTLTINGRFEDTSGSSYDLAIYGQENQTGKLIVNAPNDCCGTIVKDLEIHGGDVSFTGAPKMAGIMPSGDVTIYGGKVTATGGDSDGGMPGGDGINCLGGALTIKGQAIVKAYGGAESGTQNGGHGINVSKAIDISGSADVYAKSGKDADAAILAGLDLTFSGKQLVTEGTGNSAGLETVGMGGGSITISAGTVTLTTANGPTIQSDANVNISKCTLSATVATATSVIDAGADITIANDVTKVEMTNNSVTDPTADYASLYVNYTGVFKLGGTDISANWVVGTTTISAIPTTMTYGSKTLTYVP